jgi:hypothetical protein
LPLPIFEAGAARRADEAVVLSSEKFAFGYLRRRAKGWHDLSEEDTAKVTPHFYAFAG